MRPCARGFTLIEVVVATSLLALGLALAFGILRGAGQASTHAEQQAQRQERLRAVQGFLRAQVNAALPIGFAFDADSGESNFFRVRERELELVGTLPGYLARGGPSLQRFALVDGPGGQRLTWQSQMLTPDGPLPAERAPVVLLEGIAEARFAARAPGEEGAAGDWGNWEENSRLPPLVRLELRFADGRRWPAFVASPRMAVPAAQGTLRINEQGLE